MAGVSLYSQSFSNSGMVARRLSETTGSPVLCDQDILARAADLSDIPETKISRLFSPDGTAFNLFTLERKSALAHIRLALAEQFREGNPILTGYCAAMLIPGLPGIVKTAITASRTYRLGRAKSFHRR
ncbi:MAG TPA: hypothetical protein DHV36_19355, partial [Desulfobacteraceae bacterium]|nr:hypothetical protein [Desulfobacteraceae bacterium]